MSKKVFTLLLLAVFVLAQFSIASAAPSPVALAGTATITALPTFSGNAGNAKIDWSVTGMPGGATQNIFIWARVQATPANPWNPAAGWCALAGAANTFTSAIGSFNFPLAVFADQDMAEFYISVDDQATCAAAALPATSKAALASTFIDSSTLSGFLGNPPTLNTPAVFDDDTVACNTFEMWGLVSDHYTNVPAKGYSGVKAWQPLTTGTQAVPAPVGATTDLLSWKQTIPATASGAWSFSVNPVDNAQNAWGVTSFRTAVVIVPAETADCKSFTDTAGNANELYVRYLASLGIGAGNADGSYGPDTTLTRAEAAAFLEVANGRTAVGLPITAPSAACTFSDVAATDWFGGWVWQACADGFLNGVGAGMFDPSNTLTRGQVVTIFNNIYNKGGGAVGGYFDFVGTSSVLENEWDNWFGGGYPYLRESAWTDVSIGAFYALPVQRAYGVGVADGVTADTFAPDQAILRGEFAKMLYRALSADW